MSNGNKNDFVRACAFWGILIAATVFVVGGILSLIDPNGLGTIINILDLLAKVALLVAVAIPAYDWVKYKKVGWKVTYWIVLAVYVFGVVFGIVGVYVIK